MLTNFILIIFRLLSKWEGFDLTPRTRADLPKGFPEEIPGIPYFCDGYKHPNVDAHAPLEDHINEAMDPYLSNLNEEIPEPELTHQTDDHDLHF